MEGWRYGEMEAYTYDNQNTDESAMTFAYPSLLSRILKCDESANHISSAKFFSLIGRYVDGGPVPYIL